MSLANRLLEFERRVRADPRTLKEVSDAFDQVRTARQACERFCFMGHPSIRQVIADSGGRSLLWKCARPLVDLFYHCDLSMQYIAHSYNRQLQGKHAESLRKERAAVQRLLSPIVDNMPSYGVILGQAMLSHLQEVCFQRGVGGGCLCLPECGGAWRLECSGTLSFA